MRCFGVDRLARGVKRLSAACKVRWPSRYPCRTLFSRRRPVVQPCHTVRRVCSTGRRRPARDAPCRARHVRPAGRRGHVAAAVTAGRPGERRCIVEAVQSWGTHRTDVQQYIIWRGHGRYRELKCNCTRPMAGIYKCKCGFQRESWPRRGRCGVTTVRGPAAAPPTHAVYCTS